MKLLRSFILLFLAASVLATGCKVQGTPVTLAPKVKAATSAKQAKSLNDLAEQIKALPAGTPVKLLFVVNVKSGTIIKTGEAKRQFIFKVSDVNSSMGFTDRPQRYAFNITMPMLGTIWTTGKDSFAKDPPNAVVEDSRSRIGVTELTGFIVENDIITVELDRMAYKSLDVTDSLDGKVENITLFIDSSWLKVTGAGLAFGLQQAAKACVSVDCEFWPLGA